MFMFYYPGYYFFDPTYLLIIIGALISGYASIKVNAVVNRYSGVMCRSRRTGVEVAEMILAREGIRNVTIQQIPGKLENYYNPATNVLCLSQFVYNSSSIAAVGIAAHECGHAVQHARGYKPNEIRSALVPVANFGSKVGWGFIVLGLILGAGVSSGSLAYDIALLGAILFSATVLFQLVTLPVEFNASRRALAILNDSGILYQEEMSGARKVLSAAAFTYVASAIAGILSLLRIFILIGGRNRD